MSAADVAASPAVPTATALLPERRGLAAIGRGLGAQADVIWAIILRETRTRFGGNQLGYLWAMLEPTIVIFTFYWFYKAVGRAHPAGMDMFSFIATGVLPYTLFTNSVVRVAEAINGNKALLYYPQVRPIDLVIARALLEAATFIAVFIVLMGGHALIKQTLIIDDVLTVMAGMLLAAALGTALGLIFCGLGQLSPLADRARGPLMRPLFWISGIFFTADSLPEGARNAMLKNPILHTTELVRDGWFESYRDDHVSIPYVLAWVFGLLLVGLLLERAVRRRIEMS